jgi:trehalose/maltose transport system permease protein
VFLRVTLPLIRSGLLVAVIFRALDAMRVFDLVYVLTANAADTRSMSVYARQQLVEFQDVGLGSAASTLVFLIIAVISAVYLVVGRVRLDAEAAR